MKIQFDTTKPIYDAIGFFNAGMNRNFEDIIPLGLRKPGDYVNLGAGEKTFSWAKSLQRPAWNAGEPLPYADASQDGIMAFHFFEHLTGREVPAVLSECARVLRSGGLLSIAVPHRLGGMAFQDLDHKSFYTEKSWEMLLHNDYYQTYGQGIPLTITFNMIMGETERTLGLFTQFRKDG